MDGIFFIELMFYVGVLYYLCVVELNDNEVVDFIYFVDWEYYEMYWGYMLVGFL